MTVQKIKPIIDSEFEVARRYYKTISSVNSIHVTDMELNLLGFMATKGSISLTNNKEVFCKTFNTSNFSINNCSRFLRKKGLLFKDKGKIKIVPSIVIDFTKPVILQITLDAGTGQ